MAPTAQTTTKSPILSILAAPFIAFGRFLVMIAETGPRMQQVRKLNEMSDADLAALGTTRAEMVQIIFGGAARF